MLVTTCSSSTLTLVVKNAAQPEGIKCVFMFNCSNQALAIRSN